MDLVSYFDDLPVQLGARREPLLFTMVRYLKDSPTEWCNFSEFGRTFPGAKQVLLKPFFDFSTPQHGLCLVSLRIKDGALSESALVKAHIENRVELKCKHGHDLRKTAGVWGESRLSTVVCFSCDDTLGSSYYTCGQCPFFICPSCMVFSRPAIQESPPKRSRESSEASRSTMFSSAAVCSRPVLICIIRGHVLRSGGRLSDNFSGDLDDLHTVFGSIKTETEKLQCVRVFLLDVVAVDAQESTKEDILRVIRLYIPLQSSRISSRAIGEAQTDSLLATFKWEDDQLSDLDKSDAIGRLVLRADCYLNPKVALQSWVDIGLRNDKSVFPFMVWTGGGPADQLFFIPASCRERFLYSVGKLTTYQSGSLNRTSLHYIYCKKCLKGNLVFRREAVCDANSQEEWNPYYRIMGRPEWPQDEDNRLKWGSDWFQETQDDVAGLHGLFTILAARFDGKSEEWDSRLQSVLLQGSSDRI
mgnify:CR=1 FL=1